MMEVYDNLDFYARISAFCEHFPEYVATWERFDPTDLYQDWYWKTRLQFSKLINDEDAVTFNMGMCKKICAKKGFYAMHPLPSDNEHPLQFSVRYGTHEDVKNLLNQGFDVNDQDHHDHDHTALHLAAQYNKIKTMKLLLEHGSCVNCQNNCDYTPLYMAVWQNNFEAVDLLLVAGADINIVAQFGRSILHIAAEKASPKLLRLLLKHGADKQLTLRSLYSQTPLECAIFKDRLENFTIMFLHHISKGGELFKYIVVISLFWCSLTDHQSEKITRMFLHIMPQVIYKDTFLKFYLKYFYRRESLLSVLSDSFSLLPEDLRTAQYEIQAGLTEIESVKCVYR